MAVYTKNIVTTVAYMIGLKKSILEVTYQTERENLELLYQDKNATIIRSLCKLRTSLMQHFKKTDQELKFSLTNLDKLDWYDHENIKQLEEWGFPILKFNYNSTKYMEHFNKLISENITNCKPLFPEWVNWDYLKDFFTIPKFTQPTVMKSEFAKYMKNIDWYPFQQYVHWTPKNYGGILFNDSKFLSILYEQHNDFFVAKANLKDADSEIKERIYSFIQQTDSVEIVVDCENSNVFKLCGVLTSLDSNITSKIKKILLFDDVHTAPGWGLMEPFTKIPVEHIVVKRVKDEKSLVDIKMTAAVCTEHYKNDVSSFILFSSDSDYWGLISSLPDAHFMVMYEYSKIGEAIKKTLSEHEIFSCAIDEFSLGKINEFKNFVLYQQLKVYLPDILQYNGKELTDQVFNDARIVADQTEKNIFYKKFIQTIQFSADDDGNIRLVLPRLNG